MLTKDEITVIQASLMGCTDQLSIEMVTSNIASISSKLQKMKEDISRKDILVVYYFSSKKVTGWGNFHFKSDSGNVSYDDVIRLTNRIKEIHNCDNVIIINLIKLEGDFDYET